MTNQIDAGRDFSRIQQHADQLLVEYSERDKEAKEYENMYLMEWKDKPKGDGIKATMSPDARNSVLGVTRLLTATDPIFSVPGNEKGKDENASRIEQACSAMWDVSGRISQAPIHYDAVLSAALYAEVHIPITSTSDLVEQARQANRGQKRAEKIARLTPFLFEVWNPRFGYPEFDGLGLTAYYRRVEVYASDLQTRFGEAGALIASKHASYDRMWLNVFYDMDEYAVWVDGEGLLIYTEHGLPVIPVAVSIAEGSRLFGKPEYQRQPHLYTIRKSGLWERQNLALTVMYTHMFDIGINPTFIYTRPPSDTDSEPYHDAQSGRITLNAGASYQAMSNKGIIDESFNVALDIAERKFGESTIY